jgi:hypothetical protein
VTFYGQPSKPYSAVAWASLVYSRTQLQNLKHWTTRERASGVFELAARTQAAGGQNPQKSHFSPKTILFVALLARFLYLFFFFHVQPPHVGRYLVRQETGSIAASIAAGQGFS